MKRQPTGLESRASLLFASALWLMSACHAPSPPGANWPSYAGDSASRRYSPLDQIDASNVASLEIAWTWTSIDMPILDSDDKLRSLSFQATPLAVDGVLFTSTSLSQLAAIDADSGETIWTHDPGTWRDGRPANWGFVHRGVAYWRDEDSGGERIFMGTGHGDLLSLDARTGEPDTNFGDSGRVSIRTGLPRLANPKQVGMSSPPSVYRNVVMVGSSISDGASRTRMPPGQVRGYDARSGELLWTWNAIETNAGTGDESSWREGSETVTGNTNVWAPMSVDAELGRLYFGVSTPTNDFYGGHRLGANRFAESLVCLDALTGELLWHYQIVHHGIWDYDLPAAPMLVDLEVDGRSVAAVVQLTKQGFAFVFDRISGSPVWPIEERQVPRSQVPGEESWPTQPFPTLPPPFERQGVTVDDLIDFTPELRAEAESIVANYLLGPLYEPPSLVTGEPDDTGGGDDAKGRSDQDGRDDRVASVAHDAMLGTLQLPGSSGGANWGGGAFDPDTDRLYVPSITSPVGVGLRVPDPSRSDFRYVGSKERLSGPQGLPLLKPPWGRITAYDLAQGAIRFQVANGDGPRDHPAIAHLELPPLGQVGRAGPLVTKTLLFVADGTSQTNSAGRWGGGRALRAYDKSSGQVVATIELPAEASGVPMTYFHDGRQTIVVAVSAPDAPQALVALRLPD